MSGVNVMDKPRHPQNKSLSEALREDEDRFKAQKGLIDKRATLIKAVDGEGDADAGTGATMRPTDEQLERINQFTKRAVTADEVVAFNTLSCNDIVDRDDDQFTTQCVKDFAALEQPFSPTGKSYMLDHAYSVNNAVGRIFGTDTKKVSGSLFLTNEVYVPNTEKNQGFIEDLDFGINWAVSVGVMLGKSSCTVCGERFSSWGYWCVEGHDKGYYYDPNSDEVDSWGYPVPCDPSTKGAIKCIRQFSEPKDFYELSQVFLGAQYFAALEKIPEFASVMKSVTSDLPIIGLSGEEAEKLPFRHEPKKVADARRKYEIKEADDGSLMWTDSEGLRWTFDPENPDDGVLSLGKASNDNEEEDEDGEHAISDGSGSSGDGATDGGSDEPDSEPGDGGTGSGSDPSPASGDESSSQSSSGEPGSAVGDEEDSEEEDDEDADPDASSETDNDEEEEKSVSKQAVLSAAEAAKLPKSVIEAAEGQSDNGLLALLSAAADEIAALSTKASLGDQYLKTLRAEAIDWYTKARATPEQPKVSTETFERLLEKCGEDVDLLKAMADEQKELAQAKFPKSVRRSSFDRNPNEAEALSGISFDDGEVKEGGDDNDKRVKRIHG